VDIVDHSSPPPFRTNFRRKATTRNSKGPQKRSHDRQLFSPSRNAEFQRQRKNEMFFRASSLLDLEFGISQKSTVTGRNK
jgi:hypothetical protein